jgi:hypothetical protein
MVFHTACVMYHVSLCYFALLQLPDYQAAKDIVATLRELNYREQITREKLDAVRFSTLHGHMFL